MPTHQDPSGKSSSKPPEPSDIPCKDSNNRNTTKCSSTFTATGGPGVTPHFPTPPISVSSDGSPILSPIAPTLATQQIQTASTNTNTSSPSSPTQIHSSISQFMLNPSTSHSSIDSSYTSVASTTSTTQFTSNPGSSTAAPTTTGSPNQQNTSSNSNRHTGTIAGSVIGGLLGILALLLLLFFLRRRWRRKHRTAPSTEFLRNPHSRSPFQLLNPSDNSQDGVQSVSDDGDGLPQHGNPYNDNSYPHLHQLYPPGLFLDEKKSY